MKTAMTATQAQYTHDEGEFNEKKFPGMLNPNLPKEVEQDFDREYDGVKKYFPDLKCVIPFKRRGHGRGHKGEKADDLTPEQKRYNKELAKERVVVEHTISRMKKFRIMVEEFRNRLKRYDVMADIVSGLINLGTLGTAATI